MLPTTLYTVYMNVTELLTQAYIDNTAYNKVVTLYYTNRQNKSTPLSALNLDYQSSIVDSNWEFWNAYAPIYIDGITELRNLTYQDTDNGQTYDQILNLRVESQLFRHHHLHMPLLSASEMTSHSFWQFHLGPSPRRLKRGCFSTSTHQSKVMQRELSLRLEAVQHSLRRIQIMNITGCAIHH